MADIPKDMEELKVAQIPTEQYALKPSELWANRKAPKMGFLSTWAGGFYTITAPTGTGKTAFVLMLAICAATGIDHLGIGINRKYKVMLCLGENPNETLEKLWAATLYLGLKPEDLEDTMSILTGIHSPEQIAREMRLMGGDFELVIIDTLSVFMGLTEGMEMNSNTDTLKFLEDCRRSFREAGQPTVFAPAHPKKNATEKGAMIPFGAGSIINQVDGNFSLTSSGNNRITLGQVGKIRGHFKGELYFKIRWVTHDMLKDADGEKLSLPIVDPVEAELTRQTLSVLRLLIGQRLTYTKLIEYLQDKTERSKSSVKRMVTELRNGELIEQISSDKYAPYALTNKAAEWLKEEES